MLRSSIEFKLAASREPSMNIDGDGDHRHRDDRSGVASMEPSMNIDGDPNASLEVLNVLSLQWSRR